jgi:hypothetical protein
MTNLTPTVTQPTGTIQAGSNSVTLLSTRSMTLAGVRVKDGETLVVGGLLKESSQMDVNKVPGLDRLPILGAMFRAINLNNKDKTELVLMVTPHILKDDSVTYFNNANTGKFSNMNYGRGGIVPVALPKFTGSVEPSFQGTPNNSPVPALPSSSQAPAQDKTKTSTLTQAATPALSAPPKSARIDIMPALPITDKNEGMAALMIASPENKKPRATSAAGTINVYRRPEPSDNWNMKPLHVLDEILK